MRKGALLAVVAVTSLLAGCFVPGLSADPNGITHDSLVFDSGYPDSDYGEPYYPRYATLIEERNAENRQYRETLARLDERTTRFVDATDFDEAFVVVYQDFGASSHPTAYVDRITTTGSRLTVHLRDENMDDPPAWGSDNVLIETVLVRIHYGDSAPPETVALHYDTIRANVTTQGSTV